MAKTLPTPETHPRGYWTGRGAARRWMVLAEPSEAEVAEQVAAHKQAVAIAAAQRAVLQKAWDACTPSEQEAMTSTLEAIEPLRVQRDWALHMQHGGGPDYSAALDRFRAGDTAAMDPWSGPSFAELDRRLDAAIAAHRAAKAPLRAHIARLTNA